MVWSRCVNYSGKIGHNIPCDLHLEHLNRVLKTAIEELGANKMKEGIQRVGKCICLLANLMDAFDIETSVFISSQTGQF